MNIEQIESQLKSLAGEMVVVVRPWFGSQSESNVGRLNVSPDNVFPMKFSITGCPSWMFDSTDVVALEGSHTEFTKILIRLKGPEDYRPRVVHY